MRVATRTSQLLFLSALSATSLLAQPAQGQSGTAAAGDRVLHMSGVVRPAGGRVATPTMTVTYSIYTEEVGGTLLWQETQSVAVDDQGRYSLLLGAMSSEGLPPGLFAAGESRWMGIQFQGEAEGPRSLLTSVPYSVKASDADSLGGRPASDYLLAASAATGSSSTHSGAASSRTDTVLVPMASLGTAGRIGKFFNTTDLGDSVMFETGGRIGLGTVTPLDFFHSRFSNSDGTVTGFAVQNLGASASSYSGMLFYDQNGALGQFQGFNNSTHEYRINNIASSGTINFMIGSSSKFKVANNGFIGIGNASPENELHIGQGGSPILKIDGAVNTSGAGPSVRWTEVFGSDYGTEALMDGGNDALIFRGIEAGGVSNDNILVIRPYNGLVGVGVLTPADKFQVAGDIRVGTGTTGCVKDADGTVIAGVCSSDRRLKKQITPFGSSLDKVSRLQPVHFYWRSDEYPNRHFGASESFGLVAQDVEAVLPELVTTDETGFKAVRYNALPFHMLQAIKELKTENDDLKARLAALEAAVTTMRQTMDDSQR